MSTETPGKISVVKEKLQIITDNVKEKLQLITDTYFTGEPLLLHTKLKRKFCEDGEDKIAADKMRLEMTNFYRYFETYLHAQQIENQIKQFTIDDWARTFWKTEWLQEMENWLSSVYVHVANYSIVIHLTPEIFLKSGYNDVKNWKWSLEKKTDMESCILLYERLNLNLPINLWIRAMLKFLLVIRIPVDFRDDLLLPKGKKNFWYVPRHCFTADIESFIDTEKIEEQVDGMWVTLRDEHIILGNRATRINGKLRLKNVYTLAKYFIKNETWLKKWIETLDSPELFMDHDSYREKIISSIKYALSLNASGRLIGIFCPLPGKLATPIGALEDEAIERKIMERKIMEYEVAERKIVKDDQRCELTIFYRILVSMFETTRDHACCWDIHEGMYPIYTCELCEQPCWSTCSGAKVLQLINSVENYLKSFVPVCLAKIIFDYWFVPNFDTLQDLFKLVP